MNQRSILQPRMKAGWRFYVRSYPEVEINQSCSQQRCVVDDVKTITTPSALVWVAVVLRKRASPMLGPCEVIDPRFRRIFKVSLACRVDVDEGAVASPVFS